MRVPVLTVLEPYASALVAGVKPVENRPWHAPTAVIGRRLLIHAGKSKRLMAPENLAEVRGLWPDMPMEFPLGMLVGSVLVTGCVPRTERLHPLCMWSCGPWCWTVEQARRCAPQPLTGQQGIFWIDAAGVPPELL